MALHREYYKWHTPRLGRDMEILVHGHAGARVLVFPPRVGRFYDYEDNGMVEALREPLEAGRFQLICVDSVDADSLYCDWKAPHERIVYHSQYEEYILHEVVPFTQKFNDDPALVAHGCSLGAFHATNIAFRHPHLFRRLLAFSGRYDLTTAPADFRDLFSGYYDEDIYYHTPSHFLPKLEDEKILTRLRRMDIVLTIGDTDPFLENTRTLSQALWDKGVWHALHIWNGRAHKYCHWRRMAQLYF